MCVCVISNESTLRLFHRYITFLSITAQFNHTYPTTQNKENKPRQRPRKKETPGKVLGKIMSSNYKNV